MPNTSASYQKDRKNVEILLKILCVFFATDATILLD